LSDSRGTRTISADEAFDLPGIFYRNFQGTGIGGPLWTLTISLYYLMLLFSITPVIWLVFNRRSQAANAVGTPPAGAESFSLKNLFIAVTLVAVAAGMQALLQMHSYRLGYALLLWYGSGALVGAAIFGMVRRPIVGAFIGLVFQGLLIIVMKTLFKISL
jgi:hypothetical protein